MVVAVVEDHHELRVALGRLLRSGGYEIALFESAEAYLIAPPAAPICVVIDICLPGMSGVELLQHLRAHPPVPPIVLTTADHSLAEHAGSLGGDALLIKPVTAATLLATVASLSRAVPYQTEVN